MYPNRLTKLDLRNCFQEKHAFAPGEDDEEDEEGQDDEGDGSSGTGASDGDDADASGKGKKPVKDPEKQKASREAARYRTELRAAQKEREELAKKLQEIEDKDKSEIELKTRDLAAAQAQVEKMTQEIDLLRLEVAFFKSGAAALLNKPAQAVKLMDLSNVKSEDGKYDEKELLSFVSDWLKENAHFAATSGDDDSDGSKNKPNSGQPIGKKPKDSSEAVLAKKYPALSGRTR
jgi:hypothetical protein